MIVHIHSVDSVHIFLQCVYATLLHLRLKESTGIHKQCIPWLFPLPSRVHLKIDQRVQRNKFPGL